MVPVFLYMVIFSCLFCFVFIVRFFVCLFGFFFCCLFLFKFALYEMKFKENFF